MQVSEHFSWDEVVFSSTADRLGIKNSLPPMLADNVRAAAAGMEKVRALLGNQPLHIDSWYRCPVLNHAVGGASSSAHMQGWAVDFTCSSFGTPLEICKAIAASDIQFGKLIQEGRWVHISFDPATDRQLLTAKFVNGMPTYTTGV
jgi:hypothetical protein